MTKSIVTSETKEVSGSVAVLEVMVTKENNVFPMVPQGCGLSEIRLK